MIVLSIGTTHPWNVAGTGRDIVVGAHYNARVFTAVAAVSAQDAGGVRALHPVPTDVLRRQLDCLPWNAAGAVRVGALATAGNIEAVGAMLRARASLPAVVDPVSRATRGGDLAENGTMAAVAVQLATLPNVVLTPNLDEASDMLNSPVGRETLGSAAAALQRRGALAVLLKGGHLDGDPVDTLASAAGIESFTEPRIAGSMHGIGCTLAMVLACALADGASLRDAVISARAFVRSEIARH